MISKNQISRLFEENGIHPTKLIKGPEEYVIDSIPYVKRDRFDVRTVLYECIYKDSAGIVKVLVMPEGNRRRFYREVYMFTHVISASKLWKAVTPRLLYSKRLPIPFIVLEKVSGEVLGDWFHIKLKNPTSSIKSAIDLAQRLHKQTVFPPNMALSSYNSIDFFTKMNSRMKKTFRIMSREDRKKNKQAMSQLSQKLQRSWNSDQGFIFNDFNPANIMVKDDGSIKFLDFDQVGNGRFEFDLSFIYLAALGSRDEDLIVKVINSYVVDNHQKMYLDYFLLYRLLGTIYGFYIEDDEVKYRASHSKLIHLINKYGG